MAGMKLDSRSHQSLQMDEHKRHFVFGDIHGRHATFMQLLGMIGYDAATDVIYSVGDLIDRGPASAAVVEFFQQPHCHAILGNHEQMVLNPRDWEAVWTGAYAGGRATLRSLEAHGHSRDWLVRYCATLPICLDVGDDTQASAFRLLHAECPLDWTESRLVRYLASGSRHDIAEGRLLWGRKDVTQVLNALAKTGSTDGVEIADSRSIRTVFCGHTPVINVINASSVYWIDTYKGGVMSCMNPVSKKVFQTPLADADTHWR